MHSLQKGGLLFMKKYFFSLFLVTVFFLSPCTVEATFTTPDVAIEYNDHYYQLYPLRLTWEEAEEYFEQIGGHLATISSQEENDFLFEYIKSLGYPSAFFGAFCEKWDGNWSWVNGEDFRYSNWTAGQPAPDLGTNYYTLFSVDTQDGTWTNDSPQNKETIPFLCEWDTKQEMTLWDSSPHVTEPAVLSGSASETHVSDTESLTESQENTPDTIAEPTESYTDSSDIDIDVNINLSMFDFGTVFDSIFDFSVFNLGLGSILTLISKLKKLHKKRRSKLNIKNSERRPR